MQSCFLMCIHTLREKRGQKGIKDHISREGGPGSFKLNGRNVEPREKKKWRGRPLGLMTDPREGERPENQERSQATE